MVWDLHTFKHADLRGASNCKQQNVGIPHTTKVCHMPPEGLVFPLKDKYDKINRDIFNPLLNDSEFDGDEEALRARGWNDEPEGQNYDAAGDRRPAVAESSDLPSRPVPMLAKREGDEAEASKTVIPHMRHGAAGDGKVYLNDAGRIVKLDVLGKPYPVGADGVRVLKTARLEGMLLEAWQMLDPILRTKKYYL